MRRFLLILISGLLLSGVARAQAPAGSDVKLVVIFARHGVRPPTKENARMSGAFSAEAWPTWDVPLEYLTPHGHQGMALMGRYYRELYTQQGLLSGDTAQDAGRVYFLADSDERTIESARALGEGLVPGANPVVHAKPQNQPDPLFRPQTFSAARPDLELAKAAVLGRIGGDLANLYKAYGPEFDLLERVMLGGDGRQLPPGKRWVLEVPVSYSKGTKDEVIAITDPVHTAAQCVDNMMLEYAEGMPMKDVGWGRLDPAALTRLLRLHSLYFDLTQRTFYPAQIQMSNMLSHILQTMEQEVSGRLEPGSFGTPANRVVVVVGHDSNQASLGGLLGLNWWLPGTQANPILPGSALVFELLRHGDGPWSVRIRYVSQSLEQTRNLEVLTLDHPPQSAPIFVPDCSESAPGYEVPFAKFEALVRRVVDPAFVVSGNL